MLLWQLLSGIEIEETNISDFSIPISGISRDSRKLTAGELFVCLAGQNSDGHDFIGAAAENGAAAAVVEECPNFSASSCVSSYGAIPYIRVKNTREAYAKLWYNLCFPDTKPRLRMVALTGTNGKTTTAHMLAAILNASGHKTALLGTIGSALTTPDPDSLYPLLAEYDSEYEFLVMEASSHALALDKLSPLQFELAAFTNLTPEHLDFHKTMDAYFAAKRKLFGMCRKAVVNIDDSWGRLLWTLLPNTVERSSYSINDDSADYTAKNVRLRGGDGISFELLSENSLRRISCPMPGMFTVYNALCAVSCAAALGIEGDISADAIAGVSNVAGRLQKVETGKKQLGFSVYIDFAHTPDALAKLLKCARDFVGDKGRLVVLFGCGGDRDRLKRPEMGKIASALADFTIITSDNSRSEEPGEIIREIMKGVDKERPYIVIPNRREAIIYAVKNALPGDVIILAGKGHENYELDKSGKHPFSEEAVVKEALGSR